MTRRPASPHHVSCRRLLTPGACALAGIAVTVVALCLHGAAAALPPAPAPAPARSTPVQRAPAPAQGASAQPAAGAGAREEAYRANNLGVAYLEQYNYKQAAQSFRRALEIDGGLTLARINLAIALLYLPDHAGAEREARAALQQQPETPQAHYVLGLVARSENRPDDGVAAFTRVLAADARDVGALVNLGQLLMQRREYAEAAALFRTAVEAEPYHVTATYNLAVALTRSGQADEGQRMTGQFQTLRESGYGTTFSNTYLEQGRYAEALVSTGAEPDLVSPATPDVRFVETRTIAAPPEVTREDPRARHAAAFLSGGVTLIDLDRDDDLDLIDVSMGTLRVFAYEADTGAFTDVTTKWGFSPSSPSPSSPSASSPSASSPRLALAAIAGDYDNDERPDIFVLGLGTHALYRQTEDGRFEDRTAAAKLPAADQMRRAAAFVDVDHDGDLDLFLVGDRRYTAEDVRRGASDVVTQDGAGPAWPPAPNQLLRNNGDGTFTDVSAEANVAAVMMQGVAVAATDYDNRRDLDLVVVGGTHAPVLLRNMRDGTFQDAAKEAGLPSGPDFSAIAAGDVDKDGFTDLFLGRQRSAAGSLLLNERGRFRALDTGPAPRGALAAQFLDYDNDGLLDLVTIGTGQVAIWRNLGRSWVEVTDTALAQVNATLGQGGRSRSLRGFAAGDLDRDGDVDLVLKGSDGQVFVLANQGGNRNASVRVRLTGRASNRSGIGAKVEIRAGSLWQKLETTSTAPSTGPADVIFGLGARPAAEVVRVLWPAGIVQAEPMIAAAGGGGPSAAGPTRPAPAPAAAPPPTVTPKGTPESAPKRAQVVSLTELDRKPSSCPYLYTWNGERFEFVTDFMGGGEMGYWHAPGVRNVPDPVEYVRIRGDQLRPRDGRYELRVTNELEEALFVDRLRLIVVAHPADVEVHPREGLFAPPFPPFSLYAARGVRAPARVVDHDGRDVTNRARARDRQFIDRLPIERIRGYARPHTLTIDLAPDPAPNLAPPGASNPAARPAANPAADPDLLLLTGWTDYAFSSDNVAASQAGLTSDPPSLAVQDANGQWQTVIPEIGIPVGRPQTIVVDLGRGGPNGRPVWLSASRAIQIRTSMRIYWDQIQIATRDTALTPRTLRIARSPSRPSAASAASAASAVSQGAPVSPVRLPQASTMSPTSPVSPVSPVSLVSLDPLAADLRWRGFSAEATTEEPFTYDYARVSTTSPWKAMPGRYTREGDVRPLLRATDDMFVVSRPGDEIALSFDARALPALPAGWTHTFLLHSDGYSKEMDLNSASPDQAWPLPFHTMTAYPYAPPERYPLTAARRAYIDRYNTRIVSRPLLPIGLDVAVAPAPQ